MIGNSSWDFRIEKRCCSSGVPTKPERPPKQKNLVWNVNIGKSWNLEVLVKIRSPLLRDSPPLPSPLAEFQSEFVLNNNLVQPEQSWNEFCVWVNSKKGWIGVQTPDSAGGKHISIFRARSCFNFLRHLHESHCEIGCVKLWYLENGRLRKPKILLGLALFHSFHKSTNSTKLHLGCRQVLIERPEKELEYLLLLLLFKECLGISRIPFELTCSCNNGKRFQIPMTHSNYDAMVSSALAAFISDMTIKIYEGN